MKLNTDILNRFFIGKYSRNDFRNIQEIFSKPENRPELRSYLENHWMEFSKEELPAGDFDSLFLKIQNRIALEDNKTRKSGFIQLFQRIAAILFLPLLIAFFALVYFQKDKPSPSAAWAEIQCPLGVRTKFRLPDGSTGFLNSGSTLKYPVEFVKQREVTLSGEAFFDVVHVDNAPFKVRTPNLNLLVKGTRFNVIAYQGENTEEIILQQGSVQITGTDDGLNAQLQPGQKFSMTLENRKSGISEVLASQYTSWINGKLVFRNEGMQEVATRLGRWYNVEIVLQDPQVLNYSFHATFSEEPLEEVLKLLALTAPIMYSIEKREITGDQVYQKRKVYIRLDQKRVGDFN